MAARMRSRPSSVFGDKHGPAIAHEETVVVEIYDGQHYPEKPSWYDDEQDAR
jgi:hypothetical protein